MILRLFILFLTVSLTCCAQQVAPNREPDPPLAFPGAEGFGRYTTGGRGGKVYTVTNLSDDGPGSLRNGIQKKGARIIVFAVSGNIELQSPLFINNNDVTIAGQTAPGDGICIQNYPVSVNADNVIIRYLRFRLGDEQGVEDDALKGARQKNIMIDHCSISWATDECASFYYNENFTMQWCIISESLNNSVHTKGEHGYGGIWGGRKATFHHNLVASHTSRLPRFSGSATVPNPPDELVDFRNNVIYNWMNNNTYGGETGRYNVVNNYYKPGPATKSNRRERILDPSQPYGKFYVSGNYLEGYSNISQNNKLGIVAGADEIMVSQPFSVEDITEQSAKDAYHRVLQQAGASLVRDAVDTRIIEEVKTGTARFGKNKDGIIDSQRDVGDWPVLKSLPAPKDSDGDGMPDAWEIKYKLNPNDPSDGPKYTLSKSYTNVEVYINGLVSEK
jgi:pectate lyase